MSANSQLDPRVITMLGETVNSLSRWGFKNSAAIVPSDLVTPVNFVGEKSLRNAIIARVRIQLSASTHHLPHWQLSTFVIEMFYQGASSERVAALATLSGDDFLAFYGKSTHGSPWGINCGRDLMALFEDYDKAAGQLGYLSPLFFSETLRSDE